MVLSPAKNAGEVGEKNYVDRMVADYIKVYETIIIKYKPESVTPWEYYGVLVHVPGYKVKTKTILLRVKPHFSAMLTEMSTGT